MEVSMVDWVRVADFGIGGLHLAYELLDTAYETRILVDAAPRVGTRQPPAAEGAQHVPGHTRTDH